MGGLQLQLAPAALAGSAGSRHCAAGLSARFLLMRLSGMAGVRPVQVHVAVRLLDCRCLQPAMQHV